MIPMILATTLPSAVDAYRGHPVAARLCAVCDNDALARQRQSADVAAFAERDLRRSRSSAHRSRRNRRGGDAAGTLRLAPAAFRVILLGKDGHVALQSIAPVPAARIEAAIDAMPMRRDEMRRR